MRNKTNRKPIIVHTESSLGLGGQEIRILEELRYFSRIGVEIALIAPKHSEIYKKATNENFKTYAVRFKNKAHLPSWYNLFITLKNLNPFILNTHSSDDSWMAGLLGRMLSIPIIIRTRHVSTPVGSIFSYKAFPHFVITTSSIIKSHLIEMGLQEKNVFVIPTGIDTNRFKFSEGARTNIRRQLQIRDDEILVGNISVLRSWKGLDFFLEVARLMPDTFKFILVGDGPQRERLKGKAGTMGLLNKVVFTGHREDVEDFYCALDIFLFTSYANEGIPQSILQARSVGLPIVATSTAPVMEALRGHRPVFYVSYGDTDGAMNALMKAKDCLPLPATERGLSNQWVQEHYSLSKMIQKLANLYQEWGFNHPSLNHNLETSGSIRSPSSAL